MVSTLKINDNELFYVIDILFEEKITNHNNNLFARYQKSFFFVTCALKF